MWDRIGSSSKVSGVYLSALELIVIVFYAVARFVDLEPLDIYAYAVAFGFCLLVMLLVGSCIRLWSVQPRLAKLRLLLAAAIIRPALWLSLLSGHSFR
jgi:hypothetical protein